MKKEDDRLVKAKKRIARRHSIKEGIFASAQNAFGNHYISPFAIAINASNSVVALIGAVTGLLGPLSQLVSPELLKKGSRKKVVTKAILIEALMWIPLLGIGLLFSFGIMTGVLPILLLVMFSISTIALNVGTPAWFSWAGDLVDDKHRGRWFARRNLLIGFSLFVLAILAGFMLDFFQKKDLAMAGFIILFFLAFFFRLLSYKAMKQQYEPEPKRKKGIEFSFFDFLRKAPETNFGKFSIFRAFLGFACSISSPLLAVYLLRTLGFDYVIYTLITIAGTLFSLFVLEIWGKFADKYGNYRTLLITSILIPLIPILYIAHPSPIFLILIPPLISGIAWAGFNLSATNFIYDNVSEEKRSAGVSYYNLLVGIGVFLGAGLGAFLIKAIQTSWIEPILLIFIIGGVARAVVIMVGMPRIKEIRPTRRFKTKRALKNLIFKDAKPSLADEFHEIMSINKYLRIK